MLAATGAGVVWALGTLTPAHATLIVNEAAAIAMVMVRISIGV
jgi:hypothetical protein